MMREQRIQLSHGLEGKEGNVNSLDGYKYYMYTYTYMYVCMHLCVRECDVCKYIDI